MVLRVYAQNIEYVYQDEIVSAGSLSQEERRGTVEHAAATVELDLTEFIGASDPFGLPGAPGTRYRARLEADDGTHLLDGMITSVSFVPLLREVRVSLINDAAQAFLDRLSALQVVPGSNYSIPATIKQKRPTSREQGLQQDEIDDAVEDGANAIFSDIASMFEATVAAEGSLSLEYQDAARDGPVLDVRYAPDASSTATISRRLVAGVCEPYSDVATIRDVPHWNGKTCYEVFAALCGFRLSANYDAFPSTDITARLLTDRWGPSPLGVDLSALVMEGSEYELSLETAEAEDFAVQYLNRVGEERILTETSRPDDSAIYAALVSSLGGDGRSQQRDTLNIPLFVSHYEDPVTETGVVPDSENHPGYSESITRATPVLEEGKIWLAEIEPAQDPSGSSPSFVAYHAPDSPAAGQHPRTSVIYAENVFRQYGLRRLARYEAEGSFDVEDFPDLLGSVGDPQRAVTFLALYWMVSSLQIDALAERVRVRLSLPVDPGTALDDPQIPAVGPVLNLTATLGVGTIDLDWDEPAIEGNQGSADDYEIELSYGSIEVGFRFPYAAEATTAATDYTYSVPVVLGQPVAGRYQFRVRARNAFGTSAWRHAEAVVTG